ncbi:MAG: rhodanese-like domain-containing protein [Roseburia sp.]|nr:rhodanese-like domain-containing protein [Roseburia sp.]
MESITLQELEKFKKEEYVYVDIRGKIAYEHGHIPGAVCWDPDEEPDILPKDRKLIIYCSVGENSREAAQNLQRRGYEAYSLQNGYRAWLLRFSSELTPRGGSAVFWSSHDLDSRRVSLLPMHL